MLLIGIAGPALAPRERDWLQHPACAGVVLFARNFVSRMQLTELTQAIREAAPRPQLICVDQEGGRVQRFRAGFTALPALHGFEALYRQDPDSALALAREHAWLMASELRASGIDLSFAPVLDLARGNRAIGDRAFAADPQVVAAFAQVYVAGMHEAGMAATLKHFPGHGSVLEDTHYDVAVDPRPLDVLRGEDLLPFAAGIAAGADAVMMAHVIYPQVAPQPAGCAPRWIEDILRGELGFRGVVLSDDVGMAAAGASGDLSARIDAHLQAGCDAVLVCQPDQVDAALQAVDRRPLNTMALVGLLGRGALGWDGLLANARHAQSQTRLQAVQWQPSAEGARSGAIFSGDVA